MATTENSGENEKIKRLTLDMPVSLHKRLKLKSIEEDTTMAKFVRKLIEENT